MRKVKQVKVDNVSLPMVRKTIRAYQWYEYKRVIADVFLSGVIWHFISTFIYCCFLICCRSVALCLKKIGWTTWSFNWFFFSDQKLQTCSFLLINYIPKNVIWYWVKVGTSCTVFLEGILKFLHMLVPSPLEINLPKYTYICTILF